MKTFQCQCGNTLYFANTQCVNCGMDTGFCPACHQLTTMVPDGTGFRCGHAGCGESIVKCHNYAVEDVCNGCTTAEAFAAGETLCNVCRLTNTVPDLSVEGNRKKWRKLEVAKRRVLYTIQQIGLPIGRAENDIVPKLSFDFKADEEDGEPVYTGHQDGLITVNIREADDVEREKARVAFGEPHRTLIGHIRHELGHYYWDVLIQHRREEEFRAVFGDEREPDYATAKDRYYAEGPRPDWAQTHLSPYASMHPWEDFAETFGAYLDMISIVDTARPMSAQDLRIADCQALLADYQQIGLQANELNREMGLKDLVPEVFGPAIAEKVCFIHRLTQAEFVPIDAAGAGQARLVG